MTKPKYDMLPEGHPEVSCDELGHYEAEREEVKKAKLDLVGQIMAYEDGELEQDEVVELFQRLVDTGMAWSLQGSYGRQAEALIKAGLVTSGPYPKYGTVQPGNK